MDPTSQALRRLLRGLERLPTPTYLTVVGASFALNGLVVLALGGTSASQHVFHLSVVLVAARSRARGGLLAGALAAGLSALTTVASGGQLPAAWLAQGLAFVLVGGLVGMLVGMGSEPTEQQDDLAERERALVAQRHALLQLVSHELRTPLTVIRGSVETLRRHGAVDARFADLLLATGRSVRRLEEMLEVMLAAVEELDAGESEQSEVHVAEIVIDVASSLQHDLPDRLRIDLDRSESVVTVEPYLWLTLRCLLDNAVKFTPPREDIVVTIDRCRDKVTINLRDHGPGLPAGFEVRAFEPFTQADSGVMRTHPGIGMGLYTARRLARQLGGDVTIETAAEGGAIAQVTLPSAGMRIPQGSLAVVRRSGPAYANAHGRSVLPEAAAQSPGLRRRIATVPPDNARKPARASATSGTPVTGSDPSSLPSSAESVPPAASTV
jgi:signal transduction histidine kinase